MTSRMTGAEIILPSRKIANFLLTLASVIWANNLTPSSLKDRPIEGPMEFGLNWTVDFWRYLPVKPEETKSASSWAKAIFSAPKRLFSCSVNLATEVEEAEIVCK